jgi:hypothetical protein
MDIMKYRLKRNALEIWEVALWSVILIVFIVSAQSLEDYQNLSLCGTITNITGQQQIRDAEIVAVASDDETCGGFAKSGIDGRYVIDQLRPGNYQVYILASGYPGPVSRKVSIDGSERVSSVDFALNPSEPVPAIPGKITLEKDRGMVSGKVTRASDGKPLEKIQVSLINEAGREVISTETGPDGIYILPNIIPDAYTLKIWDTMKGSLLIPFEGIVKLKRGKSTVQNATLQNYEVRQNPLCMVQGIVTDGITGQVLSDVTVRELQSLKEGRTDAKGKFVIENIPGDTREFMFYRNGYVTNYRQELLIPGEVKSIALNLMPVAESVHIGSAGGIVPGDRGATLTIPPGALMQDKEISLTILPVKDYFVGYNTIELVDGFKIFPDNLIFTKPVQVSLPLNDRQPAGTQISISFFHPNSMSFSDPIIGKVSDDGRNLIFSITRVESYGVPRSGCVWQAIPGTNRNFNIGEIRERIQPFCENHESWKRIVNQPIRFVFELEFNLPVRGRWRLAETFDYNWNGEVECSSDWCKRSYVVVLASGVSATAYAEWCVDPNMRPDQTPDAFAHAPIRAHITNISYQIGLSRDDESCTDGLKCEDDNNLCTKDVCQAGECVHPDNEKGIICKSNCRECNPNTGECWNFECKKCEKCERTGAPEYGKCVPECITAADCPEPPDPCYRAICRADHCCDQEPVGDPPCDK